MGNKTESSTPRILDELQKRIIEEHKNEPHPAIEKGTLKVHLLVHGIVEKQILDRNPPQVAAALDRLTKAGISRHEAIHTIGKLVTAEAMDMIKQGRPVNLTAYIEALEKL